MPYYLETDDRQELKKLLKYQVCAVCGSRLVAFYDLARELPYLQCRANPEHEGIARPPSRFEKEGIESLNLATRREIMEAKHGEQKTQALEKYHMTALITREAAIEIVETLWKSAAPIEKQKAILLCVTYNLNPLMNHIFLLPFRGKDGMTWAVVIGIEATRLMAHRKHKFTYLDLTPRRATKDELEKLLGDQIDGETIYFITKLRDIDTGAEVHGLGSWKGGVYGADKGNSPANMASIRSERQALKRLYPAEMPTGVEVVDELFVSAAGNGAVEADYQVVDETTGELTELTIIQDDKPEPLPEVPSQPEKPERDPATIKNFGDLYKACLEDFGLKARQTVWKELNVNDQSQISETPEACYRRIATARR